jgi:hypothetical protein
LGLEWAYRYQQFRAKSGRSAAGPADRGWTFNVDNVVQIDFNRPLENGSRKVFIKTDDRGRLVDHDQLRMTNVVSIAGRKDHAKRLERPTIDKFS